MLVEGCHSGLFIFKLFATYWGMLFQAFRLGYLYLRRVFLGFVLGAVVRIRLIWPLRVLCLDLLGLLRPIGRTLGLGRGYCAHRSVFHLFCWDLLVDPLCFEQTMHLKTFWTFQALCLDLDRLIGPTLVHGNSHGTGRLKLAWVGFWCEQDANQHGQDISMCGQDASCHGQGLNQRGWVHKSFSLVSRSLCQATLGSTM